MASTVAELRKMSKDLTLTVTVRVTPEFRARMWLGKQLVRLAVWVWGCQVEFVDKGEHH